MRLFNFFKSKRAPAAPKLAENSNISKIIELEPETRETLESILQETKENAVLITKAGEMAAKGAKLHEDIHKVFGVESRPTVILEKQATVKDMQDMANNAQELLIKLDMVRDWLKPHFFSPKHYEAYDRMVAAMENASDAEIETTLECASKSRHFKHGRKEENV